MVSSFRFGGRVFLFYFVLFQVVYSTCFDFLHCFVSLLFVDWTVVFPRPLPLYFFYTSYGGTVNGKENDLVSDQELHIFTQFNL